MKRHLRSLSSPPGIKKQDHRRFPAELKAAIFPRACRSEKNTENTMAAPSTDLSNGSGSSLPNYLSLLLQPLTSLCVKDHAVPYVQHNNLVVKIHASQHYMMCVQLIHFFILKGFLWVLRVLLQTCINHFY